MRDHSPLDSAGRPEARSLLPPTVGVCAWDRDECTVTLALDNEEQVLALVDALPGRNRVRLLDEDRRWTLQPAMIAGRFRGWQVWRDSRPVSGLFDELDYAGAALRELRDEYAASAMSAGTAETAEQAQGEARQRDGEAETPKGSGQ